MGFVLDRLVAEMTDREIEDIFIARTDLDPESGLLRAHTGARRKGAFLRA